MTAEEREHVTVMSREVVELRFETAEQQAASADGRIGHGKSLGLGRRGQSRQHGGVPHRYELEAVCSREGL